MLPQDAGLNMERHIKNNSIGMLDFLWNVSYVVIRCGFSLA
jgi:hypothetical protein